MAPNRPFVVDPVLTAIAIGYSKYEPLFLSDAVLEALGEHPLDLPDELRRVLYRARIIVEPHKD